MTETDRKKVTVEGGDIFGEKRTYTFLLMNAETGLHIFHEYISDLIEAIPIIRNFFTVDNRDITKIKKEDIQKVKINIMEIIRYLPRFLSFEKTKYLAREMLAGSTVEIDGVIHEVGDSGIGEYTIGDPLEIYISLYSAMRANYPKYFDFLLSALATPNEIEGQGESDSTQEPN